MKALLLVFALLFALYYSLGEDSPLFQPDIATATKQGIATESLLATAFENRVSDLQVLGEGTVSQILPDDTQGSRHQRFILSLQTGQTILVAHNIDLAPRIPSLKVGDTVGFYGEYEWNDQGGVIHWTHHDPDNRHVHGWLEHKGNRYQ